MASTIVTWETIKPTGSAARHVCLQSCLCQDLEDSAHGFRRSGGYNSRPEHNKRERTLGQLHDGRNRLHLRHIRSDMWIRDPYSACRYARGGPQMLFLGEQYTRLVEDGIQCLVLPTQRYPVELEARRISLGRGPPERRMKLQPDFSLTNDMHATLEPAAIVLARVLYQDSIACLILGLRE